MAYRRGRQLGGDGSSGVDELAYGVGCQPGAKLARRLCLDVGLVETDHHLVAKPDLHDSGASPRASRSPNNAKPAAVQGMPGISDAHEFRRAEK